MKTKKDHTHIIKTLMRIDGKLWHGIDIYQISTMQSYHRNEGSVFVITGILYARLTNRFCYYLKTKGKLNYCIYSRVHPASFPELIDKYSHNIPYNRKEHYENVPKIKRLDFRAIKLHR